MKTLIATAILVLSFLYLADGAQTFMTLTIARHHAVLEQVANR
jgi:hypothetical protein